MQLRAGGRHSILNVDCEHRLHIFLSPVAGRVGPSNASICGVAQKFSGAQSSELPDAGGDYRTLSALTSLSC